MIAMISPAILISPKEAPQIHRQIHRLMLEIRDEYFRNLPYTESSIYSKFLEILVPDRALSRRNHPAQF